MGVILVIGADGQLGMSLKKISGDYPDCDFLFTDVVQLDITDEKAVREVIERSGADVIINCAAYTAVDKAESEPEAARRINALGVGVLADAATRTGAAVVHISTDYVFDGKASEPYAEDAQPHPSSVYGITKAEGERLLLQSGCRGAIVRTAWLYSEFGRNFVKTMLSLASRCDSVSVVCDQRGAPTYATDLARAVMTLVRRGFESGVRIYHFTDEGECTWNRFAERIFALSGKRCRVEAITTEQYGAPAPRPSYSVLSLASIKEAGVRVPKWEDSLAQCIEIIGK